MLIFSWIKLFWYSCFMWNKLGRLSWFQQFLCVGLGIWIVLQFMWTEDWVLLVHNTRSNDSWFMHKLCLSLHAMNRLVRREKAYITSKTLLDNLSGAWFHFLKRKTDKITHNFFQPVYISFGREIIYVIHSSNIICIALVYWEKMHI